MLPPQALVIARVRRLDTLAPFRGVLALVGHVVVIAKREKDGIVDRAACRICDVQIHPLPVPLG